MNDPWAWTVVWGLTVGAEGMLGRGGQRGKIEITIFIVNRITVKIFHMPYLLLLAGQRWAKGKN